MVTNKSIKIHKKWSLGRPKVDFWSSVADLGMRWKCVVFWIAPWPLKNREKSFLGAFGAVFFAPTGLRGGDSEAQGSLGGGQVSKKFEDLVKKTTMWEV